VKQFSLYFAAYIYIGIIATDWYMSVNDYVVAVSNVVVDVMNPFKFINVAFVVLLVSFIWFFIVLISNYIFVKSVFSRNDISVCNCATSAVKSVIWSVLVVINVFIVDKLAVKFVKSVFSSNKTLSFKSVIKVPRFSVFVSIKLKTLSIKLILSSISLIMFYVWAVVFLISFNIF
jgi:hypothetical protein